MTIHFSLSALKKYSRHSILETNESREGGRSLRFSFLVMTVTEPHFPTARSACVCSPGLLMIQPELGDPSDADHLPLSTLYQARCHLGCALHAHPHCSTSSGFSRLPHLVPTPVATHKSVSARNQTVLHDAAVGPDTSLL